MGTIEAIFALRENNYDVQNVSNYYLEAQVAVSAGQPQPLGDSNGTSSIYVHIFLDQVQYF